MDPCSNREVALVKIVLFADSYSVHTHKWATYYEQLGHKVKLVTFADHYDPKHASEIETIKLPYVLPRKLSYPTSVYYLKKVLSKFKPDILHAHYISSYGIVAALANYSPLYLSVWGTDIYHFPKTSILNRKIVEYTLNKADVICSTSQAMAGEIHKYTTKPIEITPFGVDIDLFKPLPNLKRDDCITIGTVKGMLEVYGISRLIRSFAILANQFPNIRLLIVGDGPQKSEYIDLVRDLDLENRVTFAGKVPNDQIPRYMNMMDIFVVPSFRESFGVAALEAQACGVPVIVNNVGGLPELVENQRNGIIVPNNEPETLAESIKQLIVNPELCKVMGQQGLKFVHDNFSWAETANQMLNLYNKTLNMQNHITYDAKQK